MLSTPQLSALGMCQRALYAVKLLSGMPSWRGFTTQAGSWHSDSWFPVSW
jgi:hypothetical protein